MDAANMLGVSPIEEEEHAKESRERGRSLAVPTSKEKIPRRQSLIEPARTPMIKLSPKLGSKGTLKGLRMPTLRQEVTHLRNVLPRQIAAFPALLRETEQHNANVVHLEDCSRISEAVELVDQVWSLIVVLCIVYNYLLFFFYLGIPGTPTGTALACELAAEFILLLDSCVLTYLYSWKYQLLKTLPMTHLTSWSRSEKLALITIWISSYPQHAVNVIAQISPATLSTIPFALLRVLKLLRYPEIWDYFNSLQKVVKGFRATYVKMTQYVLNICMLIHAMTMLCLTVVRIETDPQWLRKYGLEPASSLEIYTEFLLTAVSNMGGMCYGDAQPVTIYEVMIYCIVVYVGSTSFGALFADLANSIYVNNKRSIENRRKLQQIKNFAVIKGLPAKLKHRLRAYYSTMYPEFRMYQENCELLAQLPKSIRTELIFRQNVGFIQKVKLFQLSDVSFIIAILRHTQPMICMAGDHIVRKGELAESMYFIKRGLAKVVCADDENVVISYLGEGAYFGEIGVLTTGKRSTSVIAHTDCVLLSIDKPTLLEILDEFGHHKKFLEMVAKQRLETTYTTDIQIAEGSGAEAERERERENTNLPNSETTLPRQLFASRVLVPQQQRTKAFRRAELCELCAVLFAVLWNVCYTIFALCFEVIITEHHYTVIAIDIVALTVYAGDLVFQYYAGQMRPEPEVTNDPLVCHITLCQLLELIATLPVDYLYYATGEYSNVLRLLRLLKVVRVVELNAGFRSWFENYHMFNIARLVFFYFVSSHIFACIFYAIGKYEFDQGGRFDGNCMFNTVPLKYSSFTPYKEGDTYEWYVNCLYLALSIMGSNIAGDIIPMTPLERTFGSLASLISKLYIAFMYAEVSNLISSFYSAYIDHLNTTHLIVDWLKYHRCDQKIIERVENYRSILWHKYKGVDDQGLIADMPETLRKKMRMHLLEHLVRNADVIPKTDPGSVVSIVQRLGIRLFPRGEFIIRDGEIALAMYLVIEGVVDIFGPEGKRICRLTPGKCFGEMALLKERVQTRMANAYCATNVSVAVFNKEDFNVICQCYPEFKLKVSELVQEREKKNQEAVSGTVPTQGRGRDDPADTHRALMTHTNSKPPAEETTSKLSYAPRPGRESIIIRTRPSLTFANILESRTSSEDDLIEERWRPGVRGRVSVGSFTLLSIRTCACLYNVYFIPLQMAFRFEYTTALYCIEAIIMLLHAVDVAICVLRYRKYDRMVFTEDAENEDSAATEKRYSPTAIASKKRRALRMILLECFTFLPWSIILQTVYYPTYVIFFIKMIRTVKIWPAKKFLGMLKRRWMNAIRICEVVALYTVIAHIMSCSFILMMYAVPTKNQSWVKRVPYPQTDMYGFRSGNDMSGVSNFDIYCHALYFAYITFTHISIGDICAVNLHERILICVYVAFSIHVYAFLFANITSMVTDLSRGLLSNLQSRYELALKCTKADSLPPDLLSRIKAYFDFLWVDTRGIDDKFIADLPISMRVDIYLQIYQHAIENCILFRKLNGEFDKPAASSFIKLISIRKYMKGDILVKAGSLNSKIFFLLDGELLLVGINREKIGLITPGLLFGARTNEVSERSLAHLVATKISTVAVVSQEALDLFLDVFPHVRGNFEVSNEMIFARCRDALALYANSLFPPADPNTLLEDEYTNATSASYKQLLEVVYRENSNPDALLLNRSLSNSSNTPAHDESIVVYPREHRAGDGNTTQCFLRPDMRCYYMVYLANLANVFVTAIITPFHVAYYQDFSPVLAAIDTLCIIESAFNMLVRFRTAVLLRDPVYSYSMRDIWKAYNGSEFVIDLFGLSPFNLIFSCAGVQHPLYIIVPLRLLRTLIIANAFSVVSHIQLLNYRMSSTVYFLSIVSSFIFLMNYTSAMWYLISSQVEKDTAVTWEKYNNLVSASIVDKMVFSIYYTTKIVSGVGSGDSFAATNLERLVTCLIVHLGDVVFAVTFGLIAALTSTWSDETESYLLQKARIEEFAEAFKLSQSHKERVRRYYDYIQSMEYTPTIYQQARELLPPPLAKEIAYETNKHLLLPVFHDISCLNFIKQVSYNIDTEHFLPGDYVMHKGDIGEEIYFIAEGRVALVAPDKRTVYCRLENGAYFGEIALFVTCKRAYYAQAETHCCICVLKRRVMEELMKNFPAVARKIRERGEQRLRQIKERDAKFGEPEEEKDHSFASAEDCKGLIEEKEQEDSQPNGDRDEERKASPVQRKLRRRSFAHLPRSLFKNKTKSKQHVMMTPALKPAKEREVMVEDSLDSMAPLPQPDTVPKRKATNKCGPLRRRLSQLNFGKHFALSGETQIEMQWTVLKSPEDASEKR